MNARSTFDTMPAYGAITTRQLPDGVRWSDEPQQNAA